MTGTLEITKKPMSSGRTKNMLYTLKDMEFFSKYLIEYDYEKRTVRLKVDVNDIPKRDGKKLLIYDNDFFC